MLVFVLALVFAACGDGRNDDEESSGDDDDTEQTTDDTVDDGEEPAEGSDLIDATDCPGDPTTGVADGTIKLGTSLPQSGLYASFAEILRGSQAYFSYVNEELGGVTVNGEQYQIELVAEDDAYDAEQTVGNVTGLVNDDQVFGLFNVVGTKNNLAVREFVNENCAPSLFAATGAPAWGNHEYPWVLGTFLVPYPLEMQALVDYLNETTPDASIAILAANDDFGAAYVETLESLVEGTGLTIAATETYDTATGEVASQITTLAATDADVFLLGATLTACPTVLNELAGSGWDPIVYMSGTCTSKTLMGLAGQNGDGVISVAPLLDPADPANASNEAMTLYNEKVAQYQPEAAADNGIVAYGWSAAAMLVYTLENSPELTRESVMETARSLTDVSDVGLMLPGATWSVGADDWFLGEQFNLVQYSAADGFFSAVGDLKVYDDQTEEVTPESLVNG
ncbi:MAG: ABC transporter substrate-binding protein [Actinomycetota bacterium]|nr:ABC transporter substrate-binding protein [Actinomycetota bacterium]